MEVCVPHSSTKMRRSGAMFATRLRQRARSSSSLSEERSDFFERHSQPFERPAHGGVGNPDAAGFFEQLAMLIEGQVGVQPNLLGEGGIKHPTFAGWRARDQLRFYVPGLAAQPKR